MKASEFLKLVGEMLDTQQNYFHLKRTGSKSDATEMLIKAKALEKRVAAVVKEGFLEPDEPTEEQLQLDLDHAIAAGRSWGWNDDIAVDNELRDDPDAGDLMERLL